MAPSAVPLCPETLIGGGPHAADTVYPDWALLNRTARFSDQRNETTAECSTPEGQPVAVSFWLADPPAVSEFTVHCPGLNASDARPPYVICAEGAFVLVCVTLEHRTLHHFVYSAAGMNPSLHLLPDPNPGVPSFRFRTQELFGLLPCGEEHYAVAVLDWEWPRDSHGKTQYHVRVFSSQTNAWRRSKAATLHLSDSDQALFDAYGRGSSKRITVGDSAVGWVDLACGILLACNLFDEAPVMRFIPLPASRARITSYEDGDPSHHAAEHICDVVCSGGLIRFVETDFDGIGWRATAWSMKLDWDDWRRRCAVDVDDDSVNWSCSAVLPELLDLKKLDFSFPTLSVRNDNRLYMMAKVDERDDAGWVIAVVDMRRAVVEALVPVSTQPSCTMYCSCAFTSYYPADDTVEADDDSEEGDYMREIANRYWRQDWCDESLASWDFSEGEDEHEQEDPIKKEEQEPDDDGEEFPVKEQKADEEEEGQAVMTFFYHETNAGADMGNPVDNHGKSHEICQEGFDHDDNGRQGKKKKRRKRTRSSRRKKQRAQAQILARETLIRHICCILLAIIVRASIMAYPV